MAAVLHSVLGSVSLSATFSCLFIYLFVFWDLRSQPLSISETPCLPWDLQKPTHLHNTQRSISRENVVVAQAEPPIGIPWFYYELNLTVILTENTGNRKLLCYVPTIITPSWGRCCFTYHSNGLEKWTFKRWRAPFYRSISHFFKKTIQTIIDYTRWYHHLSPTTTVFQLDVG